MVASLPASDGYSQLVIPNINVTNGYAEVGLWTDDGTGGKWMLADDVSFYKQ
jgi:hypothetical protein